MKPICNAWKSGTHRALLEHAFLANDERRLSMAWADVPRGLRDDPQVLGDYRLPAGIRRRCQGRTAAREALRKHWDPGLIGTYGLLETGGAGQAAVAWKSCSANTPMIRHCC